MKNGLDYPFKKLKTILEDSDLIIGNLEAPFGHEGVPVQEKTYTFQVNPDLVKVLIAGRVNVVSLGNNHILDYGFESLKETLDLLKENNIYFAGAGESRNQACSPAIIKIKNKVIAFFSYNLTFPESFWSTDTTGGTCFPSHKFVYKNIRETRKIADYIIVACHWGEELRETPKKYQKEFAHKLIDNGVDVVIGHHPHVNQGIEIYKGKIIAYSLGNFIFGSFSEHARRSMILKLFLNDGKRIGGKIVPINVFNREIKFQPALLSSEEQQRFLEHLDSLSLELNQGKNVINGDGILINKKGYIN